MEEVYQQLLAVTAKWNLRVQWQYTLVIPDVGDK